MMPDREFSVVMANFNGSRYLAAAIESLRAQTVETWELIFVDDASTDESVELALRLARSDGRIRVLRQATNQGPGAARNRALEVARGQWMVVFDSDDLMRPQRLELLRSRAQADEALVVADNLLVFSDDHRAAPKAFIREKSPPRWIDLAEYISAGRLDSRSPDLGYLKPMVSLDLIRRSGVSYDERLRIGEDFELMARLLSRGLKLRFEPSAQYMYRKHANSVSHRIHAENVVVMIASGERLAREISADQKDVLQALARRGRRLRALLNYESVISMLKGANYLDAAITTLRAPRIWPLLTWPLRARTARIWSEWVRPRFATGHLPAPMFPRAAPAAKARSDSRSPALARDDAQSAADEHGSDSHTVLGRVQTAARLKLARSVKLRPLKSRLTEPVVTFTFDDFPRSALSEAGRILSEVGWTATYYVAGNFCGRQIGGIDYFGRDDLIAVARDGHEVGCHTFGHVALASVSENLILHDLQRNAEFVGDVLPGVRLNSFAYPFGDLNLRVKSLLSRRFPVCRGIWEGVNSDWIDLAQLRSVGLERRSLKEAQIEAWLDQAEASNGWLIFFTHDVSGNPSSYGCPVDVFTRIVAGVKKRGLKVLPVNQAAMFAGYVPNQAGFVQ